MPDYSFCLLDSRGMTQDYFVRRCSSDDDARQSAVPMVSFTAGVEIWSGQRLIDRLAARSGEIGGWGQTAKKARALPARPVAKKLA